MVPGRFLPLLLLTVATAVGALRALAGEPGTPSANVAHPWEMRVWLPERADDRDHPQHWAVRVDDDGTVLVATGKALLRFDGIQWQAHMPTGSPAWLYDLDRHQDRIAVGTANLFGWYGRGEDGNLKFHDVSGPAGLAEFGMVGRVAASADGLFFATRERVFWLPPEGPLVTLSHAVGNLLRAGPAVLLQAGEAGLLRFDPARRAFVPDPVFAPLAGSGVSGADSEDGRSGVLLSPDRGLWRFDAGGTRPWPTALDSLPDDVRFTALLRLPDARLLVGTRAHGLVALSADGRLDRIINRDDGLPGNRINGLALDPDQGVFVAIEGGIVRLDPMSGISRYDRTHGLSTVMEAVLRHRGTLFAAGSEGVYRQHAEPGRQARFVPVPGPANGVALWSDPVAGDLLIGADSGLWQLRPEAAAAERLFAGPRIVQLLPDPANEDRLYAFGTGIRRFRREDGQWQDEGLLPAQQQANIARAEFDADGALWAGTIVGALHRIEPADRWLDSQSQSFGEADGLPQGGWAHPWRFGTRLLVGAADALYEPSGNPLRFRAVLPNIGIRRIVADPVAGRYWSALGQVVLEGDTVKTDSRPMQRLGGPAPNGLFIDGDFLWIAANEGLFRIPRAWPAGVPRSVRLSGVTIGPPVPSERLGANPSAARIDVPTGTERLRVRFAIADHGLGMPITFRTRGLPGRGDWSEWQQEPFREFTNLPYGTSSLEIEGRDRAGVSARPLRLDIVHAPPWWLSVWAQALWLLAALAVVSAAIALGRRWRVRALEQRARDLEAQVAERTETIRRQRDEIAEHAAARTRFFANVSHEFRTPLTLLAGPLQALRDRAGQAGDAESRQWAQSALRNSDRLRQLVDEVLDLHRLESGQVRLFRQAVDLAALAGQVTAEFQGLAADRGVLLACAVDETVPAIAELDVVQVRRCLANLIGNALKFTPPGKSIDVSVASDAAGLRITVADSGAGIPAEDLPRVFDRYFQSAHHQALARGGTGIGLALVRELVELHGGEVGIDSTLGEGTRVWFTLPRAAAGTEPVHVDVPVLHAGEPPPVESAVRHVMAGGKTILVVDDNAELRAFLRSQIEPVYRVLEAGDGQEGLGLARSEAPDLIVTDLMMPLMDGHAFVAALRADPEVAFIPVLMLSARGQKRDIVGGLQAGADDYLAKPFDTGELMARIASMLAAQHRLARRLRQEPDPTAEPANPEPANRFEQRFLAVVAQQLGDPELSVERLATLMHMDRSTLFRKCQETFGSAPADWLRQKRLQRAHELLSARQGSVSEVAYAVGFESLSHFSRSFKAAFGKPPSVIATG